jgi:putative ABC transport system substrate-binding protein
VRRIAIIRNGPSPPAGTPPRSLELERILLAHGFALGQNLRIDDLFTENDPDSLPGKIRALVATNPDLILTAFSHRVKLVLAETKTIPVVFREAGDPVKTGVVREYARPGGNATGVAFLYEEAAEKRLELARELLPKARRIAVIADFGMMRAILAGFPAEFESQARRLGWGVIHGDVSAHGGSLAATLAAVQKARAEALLDFGVLPGVSDARKILEAYETRQRTPLIGDTPGLGVIAYSADMRDHYRRAAEVVAKILKGARPEDIPVDRDTRFELTVNPATAKAIGVTIPPSILVRADRVIS